MATIRLIPSTYAVSNTSYLSVENPSNAYANTDSTNYATITNNRTSTTSYYYYLRGFNFSDIPSNAIINSFTVKIKGYESGLATGTSYAPRLANGTSALGNTTASSNFNTSATTITIPTGALTWQQIVNYGSNFTIMVYVRRNSRNTTGYFYCYGAEILVDYTIPVYHNVSFNNTSQYTITNPSTTQAVLEGTNQNIDIYVDNISDINITDNNVNIASSVISIESGHYRYTISNITTDHVIAISDKPLTRYTVTASSSYSGATVSPVTQQVVSGRNATVNIDVNDIAEIIVKDNGSVVTPTVPVPETTFSSIPTSFNETASSYDRVYSTQYPSSNGLTNENSTTYFRVYMNTAAYSETKIVYNFDCSDIPKNAVITNVTCRANGRVASTTYAATRYFQLYSGDTAKDSHSSNLTTSSAVYDVNGGTVWTRDELDDVRIVLYIQRNNSTTDSDIRFYGATLTVTYHVPSTYTVANVTQEHTVTVEEAPYFNISASSTYAGATISVNKTKAYSGQSCTATISVANLYEIRLFDNNIDVTSSIAGAGNTYTYILNNIQAAHTLVVQKAPEYTIDSSCVYPGSSVDPSTVTLFEGLGQTFAIRFDDIDKVVVLDNNTDVTSELIETPDVDSKLFNPATFVSSSTTVTNESNALTGTDSTTYARMPIGQQTQNHMIYAFDVSSIPSNATINSVSCVVKASTATSGNITTKTVQLYSDSTAKGSTSTIPTTTGGTVTLSPGTWTRQELENIRIRFDGYYGGTSSNYNIDFYGADLTINYATGGVVYTYTISNIVADHTIVIKNATSQSVYRKVNNAWSKYSKIYIKQNNVWVEQSDFEAVFQSNKIYVNK